MYQKYSKKLWQKLWPWFYFYYLILHLASSSTLWFRTGKPDSLEFLPEIKISPCCGSTISRWTSQMLYCSLALTIHCTKDRIGQSSLFQFLWSEHELCGSPQSASCLPRVFLLYIDHASNEAVLTYPGRLVFLLQSICRRADCSGQFASPQGADIHLQP